MAPQQQQQQIAYDSIMGGNKENCASQIEFLRAMWEKSPFFKQEEKEREPLTEYSGPQLQPSIWPPSFHKLVQEFSHLQGIARFNQYVYYTPQSLKHILSGWMRTWNGMSTNIEDWSSDEGCVEKVLSQKFSRCVPQQMRDLQIVDIIRFAYAHHSSQTSNILPGFYLVIFKKSSTSETSYSVLEIGDQEGLVQHFCGGSGLVKGCAFFGHGAQEENPQEVESVSDAMKAWVGVFGSILMMDTTEYAKIINVTSATNDYAQIINLMSATMYCRPSKQGFDEWIRAHATFIEHTSSHYQKDDYSWVEQIANILDVQDFHLDGTPECVQMKSARKTASTLGENPRNDLRTLSQK